MSRQERALVILAVLFLLVATVTCAYLGQASLQGPNNIPGIPWRIVIIQAAQGLAPSFALVGLASAAGILFLRAARWATVPGSEIAESQQSVEAQSEQIGTGDLPRG